MGMARAVIIFAAVRRDERNAGLQNVNVVLLFRYYRSGVDDGCGIGGVSRVQICVERIEVLAAGGWR